jgi:crotonobetainyl-CoA:carnitine CoA-transferase CaiB-like acyl-CoA transferase
MLAGVWRARREGRGADIDLSLFEVALAQLTYLGTWVASRGYEPTRRENSAHQSLVPFQNFATADGWIVVACPKQALWEKLCAAIGREDLVAPDGPYVSFGDRDRNRAQLVPELAAAFASRPTGEWLELLQAAGVPCAPINEVDEALRDEQTVARDVIVELDHPVLGRVREVGSPFYFDGERPSVSPGPARGADTAELLRELCGYSDVRIEELEEQGAFGDVAVAGGSVA